ncbi:MAG: hypothetical protein AB9866_17305 [Syntrophobacteraceae bacterium]
MKKRGAIIGFGTVLLVLGLTGLALLQTGVISPPSSSPGRTLELQTPEQQSGAPGPQASAGGKLPPPPQATPSPPPEPSVSGPQSTAQEQSAGKPVPAPKVGKGMRVYPRQDQPEPPVVKEKRQAKGKQSGRSVESRQYAGKGSKSIAGSKQYARKGTGSIERRTTAAAGGRQPTVVRFKFDPARGRELNVAQVHFGDRVVVKVRRVGQAENQVYLTFTLPNTLEAAGYREYSAGTMRAVITPVRDNDQISLTAEKEFGPRLTKKLESREGAVLKVGTKPARNLRTGSRRDRGYYEIEMKIYSENRWNIRPRSYL